MVTGKALKTIVVDGEDLVLVLVLEEQLEFPELVDRKVKAGQTKKLSYVHPLTGKPKQ